MQSKQPCVFNLLCYVCNYTIRIIERYICTYLCYIRTYMYDHACVFTHPHDFFGALTFIEYTYVNIVFLRGHKLAVFPMSSLVSTYILVVFLIDLIAVNNQTVGQPLILQCSVTTIRDINSRVDFVWISNGTELERVEGVTGELSTNNLTIYTNYLIIPQLSITDNNSSYTCEVIINRSPLTSLSATDNFTSNITGKPS